MTSFIFSLFLWIYFWFISSSRGLWFISSSCWFFITSWCFRFISCFLLLWCFGFISSSMCFSFITLWLFSFISTGRSFSLFCRFSIWIWFCIRICIWINWGFTSRGGHCCCFSCFFSLCFLLLLFVQIIVYNILFF